MIFVDTSVWIAALRNRQSQEARHLLQLLDGDHVALAIPVRLELLSGASRQDRARLKRTLSALPAFFPSEETWKQMERWIDSINAAGDWFGIGDLLIAAIAAEHRSAVWSLDSDFSRMARLKLVKLHTPAIQI